MAPRGGGNVQGWNDGSEDYNKIYDLRKRVKELEDALELQKKFTTSAETLVEQLRGWLKKAIQLIPEQHRTTKQFSDVNEASGSTYELHLKPWIKEALEKIGENPESYI